MHPLLEKEHQQLIDLLDALDNCISEGGSANQAYKHLSDFVVLAEEHFKNEEEIMEAYHFPEIIDHKKEHAELLEQLFTLQSKLGHGHRPFGREYMQFLRNWLDVHLFNADDRLDNFLHQVSQNSKQ